MSHTHVPVSKKSFSLSVTSEQVKVFPRASYRDTAEGRIIEVDAPLWRSHYDWFWPDEGWEKAPFSARLSLIK